MTKPFDLRIQHGIAGGFAPPNPSAVHDFHLEPGAPTILLSSMVRPDGTPSLQPHPQKSIHVESDDTSALVEELETILKGLPTEGDNPGADIYGKDIGIMYQSENVSWMNTAPQGCSRMESDVKPSEEQKKQFGRAVEIVDILSKRGQA
ncbi:hypothetical protein PENSPDRAFT_102533 [Peniophora sp. CONT]|nr:hypothetical protein PENSPDRAFT_102533 [Peniophora sp. CONT]